ncbi:FGGY-family carbohydrate kinase [Fodinicola acaciae]|uniref:FGGY-family carbohydrate kinase n=1 Tax=Fodinicola acaciae TaxID=2681555 RepID=UPI0013D2CEE6|nr:FGGY-family carbohydrate kinase [Fodinicola acaciae]
MTELLLGVDIGTASSKAVLATPDGQLVATASRPHELSLPRPGWAEADAENLWWGDVVALCRELATDAVAGVCVSGVGPCLLPCDGNDNPLRPAILYGIDTRATEEIREQTEKYGPRRLRERCGKTPSSQSVGPKIAWLRRHEPQVWEKTRRWHNSHSYAVAKLTGEYVLDFHTASQCDPLFDIQAGEWTADWSADICGDTPLPRLAWPADIVGTVTAEAAAETGLRQGIPVCAGTVDATAEAFSVGVRQPGDLMVMYGSTMFLLQVTDKLAASPPLWSTVGAEPGSFQLAGGMATSGSLTAWLRQLTGDTPFADLVREAAATPPGADGLLVLPYFAGERTPHFDPKARGVIAGLTLRHTRGHLYRAAYEGIAYGIRQIIALFDRPGRIVAVGGGTQGGLWTQVVSDVIGQPQLVPRQAIGASYGDALLAAIGTGLTASATDWTTIDRTIHPDPATAGTYDELYQAFTELYPATRGQVHALADFQNRQHL